MGNKNSVSGWTICTLPEVCRMVMGQSPPSATYNSARQGLPFFQGKKEFGPLYPRPKVYCSEPNKIAEAGAVLMSIRAPVGPTNVAREKSCIGRGLAAFHAHPGIEQPYVLYFLRSQQRTLSGEGTGSTFKAVTKAFLEGYEMPLAPLAEQRAIVGKIEELFSELDKGVEQLRAVQKQLKQYRQSVLKAAFEGKLTADWRAEQQAAGKLPSAKDLLDQIKTEREARYQQKLTDWQQAVKDWESANGKASGRKKPRKPAKPKDLPPLTADELADLPRLSEGWVWAAIQQIVDKVVDGTHHTPAYVPSGVAFLSVKDIREGRVFFENCKYITASAHKDLTQRCNPEKGDVLITKSGTIGRIAVVNTERPFSLFVSVALLKLGGNTLPPVFVKLALENYIASININQQVKGGLIKNLHLEDLRLVMIRFPSLPEQYQIIQEIESRFSVLDELEKVVDAGLEQAEALRQSILKKAFEGRLLNEAELAAVRADAAYEPADKLLERIRAERQQAESKPRVAKSARKIKLPKGERYRQAAFAAYAVKRLGKLSTFGRVQQMKYLYLVPHILAQESHIHAKREAAGPLDPAVHKIETLGKKNGWFSVSKSGKRYKYRPGARIDEACEFARKKFGEKVDRVDWLLDQFAKMDTERAELLATTFAVWNDYLIDGAKPTEEKIVKGVHGWHPDKIAKFPPERIGKCIEWIKENNIVPTGMGPKTEVVVNTR